MDRYTQEFGTSAAGVMASLAHSAETMRGRRRNVHGRTSDARQRGTCSGKCRNVDGNLGAVAAAAEQMSASINEISQQTSRATQP